jgi:hypothetical protein
MTTLPLLADNPDAARNGTAAPPGPSHRPAGVRGRDGRGRFAAGNPGNPLARRVATLRQAMLDVVKPEDLPGILGPPGVAARNGSNQGGANGCP